jgi:N-methylhydantoinase A/oxoprolinase/acetone carboxylase beta subunit
VQEVQNQARDVALFDHFYEKPKPIAPQNLTFEISEPSDYQGGVLVPLDAEDVRRAARALKASGVESIGVCDLFAFANPAHEPSTRDLILEEFPGVCVSLSSEILASANGQGLRRRC